MPSFPVFASYAQADREKDLEKFISDFRDQLGGLLGLDKNERKTTVVFFDRDDLKAGDRWNETITEALRTARVLVCLMSPTYLGREWCGRELELFARRAAKLNLPAGTPARFVFPNWWQMPAVPRPLPAKLSTFHYRDAQFPERYDTVGVQGLARKALWKQFKQMSDSLAASIMATLSDLQQLPLHEPIADIREIANAFDEQQPYDVRLLALTTGGDAWRPSSVDVTIKEAADQSARRLQIFVRRMDPSLSPIDALKKAQEDQQVVLIVADATTPVDATLTAINGLDLPNLAVLLIDTGTPAIGSEAWLEQMQAGAFAKAKDSGFLRVSGPGALEAQMQLLIDDARRRPRAGQPAARAEDPILTENARQQGITINVQPHLAGPGITGNQ